MIAVPPFFPKIYFGLSKMRNVHDPIPATQIPDHQTCSFLFHLDSSGVNMVLNLW